jgi:hypothetical protein
MKLLTGKYNLLNIYISKIKFWVLTKHIFIKQILFNEAKNSHHNGK